MSTEENKAAVRRFWESVNAHNLAVWDEFLAPHFLNHDPNFPTPHADLQTSKQMVGVLLAAFPDLHSSEEDMIAEGDKVVVRRTFHATHQGEFLGIAPTGREVTYTGTFTARLTGGKIEEQWVNADNLSLLQQLGVVPSSGQAGT